MFSIYRDLDSRKYWQLTHFVVTVSTVTDEHTHTPPHLTLQDLHTLRFALKEEIHVLYDQLQNVAFPMSDSKNVFAYSFEGVYQEDGWKVYDAEKELQRMVRRHNSWGGEGGGVVRDQK